MTPVRLVVVDLDQTIAASPPWQPGDPIDEWEARVLALGMDCPVVAGAKIGLRRILREHSAASVAILTARHNRLRTVTVQWIARHFPVLDSAIVVMRSGDGDAGEYKRGAMMRIRGRYPGRAVVIDDQPWDGVEWIEAPGCWEWWRHSAPAFPDAREGR